VIRGGRRRKKKKSGGRTASKGSGAPDPVIRCKGCKGTIPFYLLEDAPEPGGAIVTAVGGSYRRRRWPICTGRSLVGIFQVRGRRIPWVILLVVKSP